MPDAEKKKKEWLGRETFPTIWLFICLIFNWIGILALLMLAIAELVIIVNNWKTYHDTYGYKYPASGYIGGSTCGFVEYTNAPKHLGSILWTLAYQVSIIIFALMAIASDFAWRNASYNKYGQKFVQSFYAEGIMTGERDKKTRLPFYVVANAWLKFFITILYMQQTFYGLRGGSHSPSDCLAASSVTSGSVTASTSTSASTTVWWSRDWSDNSRSCNVGTVVEPGRSHGVELWAFWCGWIVFGSIVPCIIAFIFLVEHAANKKEGTAAATTS
ncbi:hypothetical protein M231_03607 [Tremella mesenterica]|uniref:Uncharacterized protein n=1 Tax=Tremella mesenterica TaxID=5217 RepID=A0A4Q1BN45_TREME|nr:hypothetical protein M231_03607 [Tremella mesenterica]